MLIKRTSKNQVTIPKKIIDHFKGIEYFEVSERQGRIILNPIQTKNSKETLQKLHKKIKTLRITQKNINDAIRWARKASD